MTETIVARIAGGLGNQLFIYAAARRIAAARGARLLLDRTSSFAKDKYGAIDQLGHFAIAAPQAPPSLCFATPLGRRKREILKTLSKHLPRSRKFILKEEDFVAAPGAEPDFSGPSRRGIFLEGYWQSPRYFRPIEAAIRKELTIVSPLSETSREVAAEIDGAGAHAVCFHIRQKRGAALAPGIAAPAILPQLPFAYYRHAVAEIADRVGHPVFFCFGDDDEWLPARWTFPHPVRFVAHNRAQETAYEDLALMLRCRHFITANSTFSWWAAFLADHADKIVVAPKSEGRLSWASEPDIIPKGWLALSADG